jgi:nucleoside-diphosphate-sugar epimerase
MGGTPEQVMKFVPPLLAGETIGMMSLTESGGGSDPLGNMRTTAQRDGDVDRINGSKMWACMAALMRMVNGERGRHEKVPNDSSSMIHLDDLANLFMAVYENPKATGRYLGVYDFWPWQDIYHVLAELIPEAPMPEPLGDEPAEATTFDFTRRDSLGVPVRAIPEILKDAIAWCRKNN